MNRDTREVVEIILDELAQVLGLSHEAVARCRRMLDEMLRPRRRALFLATGEQPPCEVVIESFRALTAFGVEATLLCSHSFSQVWPRSTVRARLGDVTLLGEPAADEAASLPDRFPLLCVLALSTNTVVKTVLGLRDSLPALVLRSFLERGRPVVAAGIPPQRLDLDGNGAIFWNLPLAVRQWVSLGYRTLEQWGVEFVEPHLLTEAVKRHLFGAPSSAARGRGSSPADDRAGSNGRVFVTVEDVRSALARGEREIRLSGGARATDEAREFARRWGIELIE